MTQVVINGNTYSDDGTTAKDMLNGGHATHFFPMISDVVVVAGEVSTDAATASSAASTATAAMTSAGTRYNFDNSTTMADPGTGDVRLNHATLSSVTAIAVSASSADSGNPDVSDWVATWGASTNTTIKGHLVFRKIGTPSFFAVYSVSAAVTDNTSWLQITVTHVASNGTLSNADQLVVQFARAGDKGLDGGVASFNTRTGAVTLTSGDVTTALTYTPATTAGNTFTGAQVLSDQQVSRAMLIDQGYVFVDKGNSGTSTQTLDYTAGSHQKITATGNHTIATSNWPPSGNTGVILLELVNGGAFTITWPTINWVKPDGTLTTSFSTWIASVNGRTALQTSGTDFIRLISRDGGTTIYGGFAL
jgi:hypothetical protein